MAILHHHSLPLLYPTDLYRQSPVPRSTIQLLVMPTKPLTTKTTTARIFNVLINTSTRAAFTMQRESTHYCIFTPSYSLYVAIIRHPLLVATVAVLLVHTLQRWHGVRDYEASKQLNIQDATLKELTTSMKNVKTTMNNWHEEQQTIISRVTELERNCTPCTTLQDMVSS